MLYFYRTAKVYASYDNREAYDHPMAPLLTEINDKTKEVPAELLENPEINKALEEVKISAFSDAELRAYDKFWDVISSERTLLSGSYDDGQRDAAIQIAKNLKKIGMDVKTIMEMTGLNKQDVEKI